MYPARVPAEALEVLVARRQGPPTVEATLWTQAVDGLLPLVVALGVERELLPHIKRHPHNIGSAMPL